MKKEIEKKIKEYEEEYILLRKIFKKGIRGLSEEEVDRGADLEGWIEDLKFILNSLNENKKLCSFQIDRLKFHKIVGKMNK